MPKLVVVLPYKLNPCEGEREDFFFNVQFLGNYCFTVLIQYVVAVRPPFQGNKEISGSSGAGIRREMATAAFFFMAHFTVRFAHNFLPYENYIPYLRA